jgi:hypothetical protein
MQPITKAIYLRPQWVQPKTLKNRFQLCAGEEQFATLEYLNLLGSLALATAEDGRWTFNRVGVLKTRVIVRAEGQDNELAVYTPRWTGTEGTLQMSNGAAFTWKVANFWATQFIWRNAAGRTLINYRQGIEDSHLGDFFKSQARVEMMPEAHSMPELSLLVALGWYLMILHQQDISAAAAT